MEQDIIIYRNVRTGRTKHCNAAMWNQLKNVKGIVNGKRINVYERQNVKDPVAFLAELQKTDSRNIPSTADLHLKIEDAPQPQVPESVRKLQEQLKKKREQAAAKSAQKPITEVETTPEPKVEEEQPEKDDSAELTIESMGEDDDESDIVVEEIQLKEPKRESLKKPVKRRGRPRKNESNS